MPADHDDTDAADVSEHPWERQFVSNMVSRRKALGMSQTGLAKALAEEGLPFHQPTVQRIESGERPIRINEAVIIVRLLEMSPPGVIGLDIAIEAADTDRAADELRGVLRWAKESLRDMSNWRNTVLREVQQNLGTLDRSLGHYRRLLEDLHDEPDIALLEEAERQAATTRAILKELETHYGERSEEA